MTAIGIALGLTQPFILGLALCSAAFNGLDRRTWLLAAALSGPFGLALTSALFFLYTRLTYPGHGFLYYAILESLLAAGGLLFLLRRRRSDNSSRALHTDRLPRGWVAVLAVALVAAVAISLGRFWTGVLANPDGRWDAWITWNLRARFIFLGGERWLDGFSRELMVGQTDYPLLVPISVARLWFYAGEASRLAPAVVAFLFTFSIMGAVGAALSAMRLPRQAVLAVFTLASAPALVEAGAMQFGDVPVAAFILGSLILYFVHASGRMPVQRGAAVLLGASLGAAAWTKPEGLSFLVCFLICWVFFEGVARKQRLDTFVHSSLRLAAGLLPFALCLVVFQRQLAGANRFFSDRDFLDVLGKLSDAERYAIVAGAFLKQAGLLGGWTFGAAPLVTVGLVFGIRRLSIDERKTVLAGAITLCLAAASYFLVYVISPGNPQTRMSVSLSRVVLQLYPALVFLVFFLQRWPLQPSSPTAGLPAAE